MQSMLPTTPCVPDAGAADWYQDAVIYELHVRAFCDSNGDGIGDFAGLTQKLDYVQELGVTAIWLLPFFPSPLLDDGYDIADYTGVHPAYGTLEDFRTFLAEAHRRQLRVIIELVLNHTSDQHPWFQRARHAPKDSPDRAFYVWSDTPDRYGSTRVIFQDYEHSNWAWDPVAEQYFWHRFYSHQPDLNYDHPPVREAIVEVVDFWLGLGVDGLRLDAVPYLYERDGTVSENLAPTHRFLKELRRHIDERFPGRMLLAEANQWPEDAVAYFGEGDECHMAFHFPLMPRLFMALRAEDRFPIQDILAQTPPIPDGCQWALFLRNHDELTLEMVTDEERISMLRAYARSPEARVNLGIRRRLAPLLGNDRRQIELLNGLLAALPGAPVLYYGDEIGMGDNIYLGDRDGVRTPMQWNADRNAGFSQANPQQLYLPLITDYEYHHEAMHVEAQQRNPHSLLHWMRRLLALRRRYAAFGRGDIRWLHPANQQVLAFVRRHADEQILVVANLSRRFQHVALELEEYVGSTPVELFGQTRLPPVAAQPYVLTLAPHTFHWFALECAERAPTADEQVELPASPLLMVAGEWDELLHGTGRTALTQALPAFLRRQPWFLHADQPILAVQIEEGLAVPCDHTPLWLVLVSVELVAGMCERYQLVLAVAEGRLAAQALKQPGRVVAQIQRQSEGQTHTGVLYDALALPEAGSELLACALQQHHLAGVSGDVIASCVPALQQSGTSQLPTPEFVDGRQRNTVLRFGEQAVLKVFRHLDEGINPELEIGQYLTDQQFPHTPAVLGVLAYQRALGVPITLGIVRQAIQAQDTGWGRALEILEQLFALVAERRAPDAPAGLRADALLDPSARRAPAALRPLLEPSFALAELLGQRTAALHRALAASDTADFAPEPFTRLYQRSLYQSLRGLTGRALRALRMRLPALEPEARALAERVLAGESALLERFVDLRDRPLEALRIRCHGDYHLDQVLWTGDDVVIIDFEGETGRPLLERRLKHSPLWDVAGMVHSFACAAQVALEQRSPAQRATPDDHHGHWAAVWQGWAAAAFVRAYLEEAGGQACLPQRPDDQRVLLDAYLLQKALHHLHDALERRPALVRIALVNLLHMLER
ncbi:MAG TPA: maltose alpha-D-glucosyltransferase [Roseiflexaceae bacterium]|nr:maltose alpha-D-glucosyltransferase [Roseiflexaceae bacterium]